jgi:ribonuclease-3
MAISREQSILASCQATIGYTFQKPELLRAALTHTSSANTYLASNERMEFLGDSVLGLATCALLYERFPEYQEGELTKIKSIVVSRRTCAEFSRQIGLGDFLFLGKGVNAQLPPNMLADVFEALVAAIFLDGGWEAAREFVLRFVAPELDRAVQDADMHNSKSILQQVAQKEYGGTPRYVVLDEQGPDHNKCYKVAATVNDHPFPPAWGKNKKEAELKAAMNALAAIQHKDVPYPSA